MASRTITGTLPTYPRSTVRFRQLATFVTTSATYPAREYPASTDSAGAFTIALPIPESGTVAYLIELPDGTAAGINLGAGLATTLELLLAGAFAVGSVPDVLAVLATLIAEHAAIKASTTVFGHVKPDGDTIVSVDGVLTSTGGVLSGAAGGVLAGNYPNPSFASDMATQAELDAEASTRSAADTTNASAITSEATARATADSTLQTNITSEASARSAADTTLQTNITSEASTRASADTTLQTNITAEISARAAADSAHVVAGDPHPQYQTQAESDARYYQLTTDLATQAELDAEATARASADTTNAGALTTHEADTTAVHGITDTTTLYRAGGTDVALADGGTGASLSDPNADRILFWDDSAGATAFLTPGTNLTITGTTIDAAGGSLSVEEVDGSPTDSAVTKIVFPNGTLGIASHVATYTPAASGAPDSADYVVETANAGLSAESVLGTTVITTLAQASRQAAAKAGRLFLPSDGFTIQRDTGAAWVPWGPLFPMADPALQTWSWLNQGSASVDTTPGGHYILAPAAAGHNLKMRAIAVPSTPYTLDFHLLPNIVGTEGQWYGAMWHDGTKVHTIGMLKSTNVWFLDVSRWTNATTFGTQDVGLNSWIHPPFYRLADDGTNRKFSISRDGQHWILILSLSRTTHLTPTHAGFFVSTFTASYDSGLTCLSVKQS